MMTPKHPHRPAGLALRVALLLMLAGAAGVAFLEVVTR